MKTTYRRAAAMAVALTLSLSPAFAGDAKKIPAKQYGKWGVDLEGMDKSVKPGDDFFRFVNGKWV